MTTPSGAKPQAATATASPGSDVADNPFEHLWRLGYQRLCPIIPPKAPISERSNLFKRIQKGDDARGKAPGIRWPEGTWSGFDWVAHESSESDLARWAEMGAGVGVKTGLQPDGTSLLLIDADTVQEELAAIIKAEVERRFGPLPVRIGRYPKAGYVVRVQGEFQYSRIGFGERNERGEFKERVEILSDGRQFVAEGIHPNTGKPYRWPRGVPRLADVPIVDADALTGLLEALRPLLPAAGDLEREGGVKDAPDPESLRGEPELVKRAIGLTPNISDFFPTRESWLKMGYALHGALPDDPELARELWHDWSARWQDGENDPDIVEADWNRMKPPYRLGASYIYETAERCSAGRFNQWERWTFGEPEICQNLFEKEQTAAPDRRFEFIPFGAAADRALEAAGAPLIDGLLDAGAMSVLYGDSNAGKTFVALDMAHAIATGRPWGGMAVTQGIVGYVAAEGGRGILKRAAALRLKHGAAERLHLLLSSVNLLRADADLAPLIAAARGLGDVSLLVLDTLSRVMSGGDENSSVDMGALVKNLDRLRAALDCHLLVIHHTGKDKAKGARGHSLLRAATDTEIEVQPGEIAVTKQRDLEGGFAAQFELESVPVGIDARDRVVTSATVVLRVGGEGAGKVSVDDAAKQMALGLIAAGEWRDSPRALDSWVGVPIAQALSLDAQNPDDRAKIKNTITAWLRSGDLKTVTRMDAQRHRRTYIEVARQADHTDKLSGNAFD